MIQSVVKDLVVNIAEKPSKPTDPSNCFMHLTEFSTQSTVSYMRGSGVLGSGTTLLIGFDSAWSRYNNGAVVGVIREHNGSLRELEPPQKTSFAKAETIIHEWQNNEHVSKTIILLDQPTIVTNAQGQRPVENIVASPVGRRYGGVQPANTSRDEMFGPGAPVWQFLNQFGGVADPLSPASIVNVYETYPVLAMIAFEWILRDARVTGRLPKYNPKRKKTFSICDWQFVCDRLAEEFAARHLSKLEEWIKEVRSKPHPRKADQDCLDACVCLLVALYVAEFRDCLMVGNIDTGYIVVPHGERLRNELEERCNSTDRESSLWVKIFNLDTGQQ